VDLQDRITLAGWLLACAGGCPVTGINARIGASGGRGLTSTPTAATATTPAGAAPTPAGLFARLDSGGGRSRLRVTVTAAGIRCDERRIRVCGHDGLGGNAALGIAVGRWLTLSQITSPLTPTVGELALLSPVIARLAGGVAARFAAGCAACLAATTAPTSLALVAT